METGKIAGANIAGCDVSYDGGIRVNSLTVFDKVYFSIGYVYDETKLAKRIEKDDVVELYYFDGKRMIGAEIINNVKYAGLLKHIIKKRIEIDIDRLKGLQDFIGFTAPAVKPSQVYELSFA
jgi:hypothetical protein